LASTFLNLFVSAAPSNIVTKSESDSSESYSSAASGGYTNAAYFVNWGIYGRNYQPQQLPASELTHVLYAFANIGSDGTVTLSDTYADLQKHYPTDSWNDVGNNVYGCVKQLYLLKKANRAMKTLLSIGGWTYSTNFSPLASTAAGRTQFATTAVQFVKDLGFDGIDIDWEYPASATDAANFVLLLQAVRSALDAYAAEYAPGYHFLITVASPAGPTNYNIQNLAAMDPLVDSWHLMAYDYAGSWDTITGHDANLYMSSSNPASTDFDTTSAVTAYLAAGVTASKLIVGLPLYGRSFEETTGMGEAFTGIGTPDNVGSFEAGVWDYKVLPRAGAIETYDSDVVGAYSYDSSTQELISYDNVEAVQTKAQYVRSNNLGGAFFWEASGDRNDTGSLISTTAASFGSLDQTQNNLNYSGSQYANMAAGMPS